MTQPLAIVHARGTAMLKSVLSRAIAAWLDEPEIAEVMPIADRPAVRSTGSTEAW